MMLCLRRTLAFIYFRWANTQASCKLVIGWPRAGSHPHKTDPTHTHIQTPTDSLGHSRGPHVALKKIQTHTHTHTDARWACSNITHTSRWLCLWLCLLQLADNGNKVIRTSSAIYRDILYLSFISF